MSASRDLFPPAVAGRVISVMGTKGGSGTTMIATNLAVAMHAAGRRVCLVDLDVFAGDAVAVMGLEPVRTLADWDLDDEDAERNIARVALTWRRGLDCVAAPLATGAGMRLPVPVVEGALNTLAQHYDAVIVDIPACSSPYGFRALECSHEHVLVTTPERTAMRRLRQMLETMDFLQFDPALRSVVSNRSDRPAPGLDVPVVRSTGVPLTVDVPISSDVAVSINRGVPMVAAQPEHPVSTAISSFARALLPDDVDAPVVPLAARGAVAYGTPTGRGP